MSRFERGITQSPPTADLTQASTKKATLKISAQRIALKVEAGPATNNPATPPLDTPRSEISDCADSGNQRMPIATNVPVTLGVTVVLARLQFADAPAATTPAVIV